jgi:alkylation response protein AidB-like acyl-CoA dehydrogenase
MDFSLSEEQRDVKELASQILTDLATPERLRAVEASGDRFDTHLWSELASAGLLGVAVEEAYGGSNLGFDTLCLLIEEAGRTVAPVPLVPVLVSTLLPLQAFASEALKQSLLPAVVAGECLVTAALLEPNNDRVCLPSSIAVKSGDGWLLSGQKTMVPVAQHADKVLLAARSDDAGLIVALIDVGADGVRLTEQHATTGEPQFALELERVAVDGDAVIAVGERAQRMLEWIEQHTQAALCAMTLGVTEAMMRMTASYTSEREQFGVPIATFQAVSHRAADAYIDVMVLRLVTEQALALLTEQTEAAEAVSIAKIWAGDVAHRVSQSSQHLHGGIGVDCDYPLFRYCLWAKQLELTLGSSSAHLASLGDSVAAWATAQSVARL